MSKLDEIIAYKRDEIERIKRVCSIHYLESVTVLRRRGPSSFKATLRAANLGLIAEVKRKSPSAGVIRDPFNPAAIARSYAQAGAQAISVLIDRHFFGGGEQHATQVRHAVSLPILYKEFVVDAWQIWHAASLGTSAVLLIAAVLPTPELEKMLALCREANLDALVEVHGEEELDSALQAGAEIIGINNRNLKTFEVSLDTTYRLLGGIPNDRTIVSESGIGSAKEVRQLHSAGVHAVLVGEHLLRQPDIEKGVREMMADR